MMYYSNLVFFFLSCSTFSLSATSTTEEIKMILGNEIEFLCHFSIRKYLEDDPSHFLNFHG